MCASNTKKLWVWSVIVESRNTSISEPETKKVLIYTNNPDGFGLIKGTYKVVNRDQWVFRGAALEGEISVPVKSETEQD